MVGDETGFFKGFQLFIEMNNSFFMDPDLTGRIEDIIQFRCQTSIRQALLSERCFLVNKQRTVTLTF